MHLLKSDLEIRMNARGMTIAQSESPTALCLAGIQLIFDHIVVFDELAAPRREKLPSFGRDNYTDRAVDIGQEECCHGQANKSFRVAGGRCTATVQR